MGGIFDAGESHKSVLPQVQSPEGVLLDFFHTFALLHNKCITLCYFPVLLKLLLSEIYKLS